MFGTSVFGGLLSSTTAASSAPSSAGASTTSATSYGVDFRYGVSYTWLRLIQRLWRRCGHGCHYGGLVGGGGEDVICQVYSGVEGVFIEINMSDPGANISRKLAFPQRGYDCRAAVTIKLMLAYVVQELSG